MSFQLTDKYIIIRIANSEKFEQESFRTLWIDEKRGIQEIMGTKMGTSDTEVQAYVFDKNIWTLSDARDWVKTNQGKTSAEILGSHRTFVSAGLTLCEEKPNLSIGSEIRPLKAEADLNDKYFFYVPGVHEGVNGNDDYFFKDELVKNYKSAGYQLIDWEHCREQVLGFSLESELITFPPEKPIAIAFTGILNRMSPYMKAEERFGDKVMTRDEIIRNRFFEGKLAVSMECYFDRMRCMECGYETDNYLDYEFHLMTTHRNIFESGGRVARGLIGVDFVGWGIVEMPADSEAYINSLRTSDDGTIKEIAESCKSKYGDLAANVTFANQVVNSIPMDEFDTKMLLFASEKVKNNVESNTKDTNKKDNNIDDNPKGGLIMFKLKEKISAGMSLSEVLVVAQTILKEFKSEITEEVATAFMSELSDVVKPIISAKEFKISDINTVTEASKEEAIKVARDEEKAIAQTLLADLDAKCKVSEEKVATLETAAKAKEEELATMKKAEARKEIEKNIDAFIADIKSAGVFLASPEFEQDIRTLVEAKIGDVENLKSFKAALIASAKQSILTDASTTMKGNTLGVQNKTTDLEKKLEEVRTKK